MRKLVCMLFVLMLAGCSKPLTFEEADQLYKTQGPTSAVELFTPLADKGDYRAQLRLGMYYLQKASKNPTKSVQYFKLAAEQGDVDALYFLGQAYIDGDGVPQNGDIGEQYLLRSANAGNRVAMSKLGHIYKVKADKSWAAVDFIKAASWYEQSFEYGDRYAAYSISGIYNRGPIRDDVKSAGWDAISEMTQKTPPATPRDPYQFLTKDQRMTAVIFAYSHYKDFGSKKSPHTLLGLSKDW